MLDHLKELCALDGVSGWEDQVRDYIRERAARHCNTVTQDALGSLICEKKGAKSIGQRVMLCAHMDEVGLIIKSVTDKGYLKFSFVGGVDRRVMFGKRVIIGKNRVPGVVGLKALHLSGEAERKSVPKLEDMYIDIGAGSRTDAEALVSPGEVAVFDSEAGLFGDGMIKARALDDRIGCAVMLSLMEEELPIDAVFVFTVMEEIGTRGAASAAYAVRPDIALILEGTTAADLPCVPGQKTVCTPGGGAVIPFMDRSAIYDRGLCDMLRNCAEDSGIKWQYKEFVSGGTDASAIQTALEGARVCALAAAVRNIHSPASVACLSDIEDMREISKSFLSLLGGDY